MRSVYKKITICYLFNLGSRVVLWRSKRLSTVSLSTIEAEYRAGTMEA